MSFGSPRAFKSAFVTKRGNGRDKASKFAPSRGVLLVARGNLARVYYPSFNFLSPSDFPTFVFSLFLRDLHSLKLSSPFQVLSPFHPLLSLDFCPPDCPFRPLG